MTNDSMNDPQDSVNELEAAAIDTLFGGEDLGASSASAGDELDDLRAFRAACHDALVGDWGATGAERASESLRAERVSRRILARTTREDLGRRGDVGLVLEFVSERLRDSALLRVAAALLVVQVTVVPLVAWHILSTPELEGFRTGFEPRIEDFEDEAPIDSAIHEVTGGTDWSDIAGSLARLEFEEDIAQAQAELDRVGQALDLNPSLQPGTALGRALDQLCGAPVDSIGDVDPPTSLAEALVVTEVALTRLSASGDWRGLSETLEGLAALADSRAASARGLELTRRAFAHAGLLGVATPTMAAPTPDDGWATESWLEALASEVAAVGSDDPYVEAWVTAVRDL